MTVVFPLTSCTVEVVPTVVIAAFGSSRTLRAMSTMTLTSAVMPSFTVLGAWIQPNRDVVSDDVTHDRRGGGDCEHEAPRPRCRGALRGSRSRPGRRRSRRRPPRRIRPLPEATTRLSIVTKAEEELDAEPVEDEPV